MSGESDLIKLYSKKILALAADIPRTQRLEAPDATVKKRSPLCGSTVTVDLTLADGRVSDYGQDVKACALGQAAASVVGGAILVTFSATAPALALDHHEEAEEAAQSTIFQRNFGQLVRVNRNREQVRLPVAAHDFAIAVAKLQKSEENLWLAN